MSKSPSTCIDLFPQRLIDPLTDRASWFVDENDAETGNLYESYEFKTEKQAQYFIDLWATQGEEYAIKYHHCLNRSK
jgi:hypothetical protein